MLPVFGGRYVNEILPEWMVLLAHCNVVLCGLESRVRMPCGTVPDRSVRLWIGLVADLSKYLLVFRFSFVMIPG